MICLPTGGPLIAEEMPVKALICPLLPQKTSDNIFYLGKPERFIEDFDRF